MRSERSGANCMLDWVKIEAEASSGPKYWRKHAAQFRSEPAKASGVTQGVFWIVPRSGTVRKPGSERVLDTEDRREIVPRLAERSPIVNKVPMRRHAREAASSTDRVRNGLRCRGLASARRRIASNIRNYACTRA